MTSYIRSRSSSPDIPLAEVVPPSLPAASAAAFPPHQPPAATPPQSSPRRHDRRLSPVQPLSIKLKLAELDLFAEALRKIADEHEIAKDAQTALMEYARGAGFDPGDSLYESDLAAQHEIRAFSAAIASLRELHAKHARIAPEHASASPGDRFPYEFAFAVPDASAPSGTGTATARFSVSGELGQLVFESETMQARVFDGERFFTRPRPAASATRAGNDESGAGETGEPALNTEEIERRRRAKGKQKESTPAADASPATGPVGEPNPVPPDYVVHDAKLAAALQRKEFDMADREERPRPPEASTSRAAAMAAATPAHQVRDDTRTETARRNAADTKRHIDELFNANSSDLSDLSDRSDGERKVRPGGMPLPKKPRIDKKLSNPDVSEANLPHLSFPAKAVEEVETSDASSIPDSYADIKCYPFVEKVWAALPETRKTMQGLYVLLFHAKQTQESGQTRAEAVEAYLDTFNRMKDEEKDKAIGKLVTSENTTLRSVFSKIKRQIDDVKHDSPFISYLDDFEKFVGVLPPVGTKSNQKITEARTAHILLLRLVFPPLPFLRCVKATWGDSASQQYLNDAFQIDETMARHGLNPGALRNSASEKALFKSVLDFKKLVPKDTSKKLLMDWRTKYHAHPLDSILERAIEELQLDSKSASIYRISANILPYVAVEMDLSLEDALRELRSGKGMNATAARLLGIEPENFEKKRAFMLSRIGRTETVKEALARAGKSGSAARPE